MALGVCGPTLGARFIDLSNQSEHHSHKFPDILYNPYPLAGIKFLLQTIHPGKTALPYITVMLSNWVWVQFIAQGIPFLFKPASWYKNFCQYRTQFHHPRP